MVFCEYCVVKVLSWNSFYRFTLHEYCHENQLQIIELKIKQYLSFSEGKLRKGLKYLLSINTCSINVTKIIFLFKIVHILSNPRPFLEATSFHITLLYMLLLHQISFYLQINQVISTTIQLNIRSPVSISVDDPSRYWCRNMFQVTEDK